MNMKKHIILALLLCITCSAIFAQRSPTLFHYGEQPVQLDEFLRMYTKNLNKKKPDFSKEAVDDYLRLYSLFKMKVAEANRMQLDTMPHLQQELVSYRKQLSKTYLTDGEVTDGLIREAYNRMQQDVRIAHIMIPIAGNSFDTLKSYKTIDSIHRQVKTGKISFEQAARKFSSDKQSAAKGGDIGYITALQVVYPFENMAYKTAVGQISNPFRTVYGYHIIKKLDERPARGEIQVAQIMTRVKKSLGDEGVQQARAKIEKALAELKQNVPFKTVAEKYNEDEFSKSSMGVLPPFGVGKMVPQYEDAAFALKKPTDFSDIIQTENGFHIISLIEKIPVKSFDEVKKGIQKKIERDGRMKIAQDEYLNNLKKELDFRENSAALDEIIEAIPDSTLRGKGNYNPRAYGHMTKEIFALGNNKLTQADFAQYIKLITRGKVFGAKNFALKGLYDNYVKSVMTEYQEINLAQTNPEYKNLLQEYRDGILIFELTDKKVWGKAPKDSVGIQNYYDQNKARFTWGPSVQGKLFRAKSEENMKKLLKGINAPNPKGLDEIVREINGDGPQDKMSMREGRFEQNRFKFKMPFKAGKYMPYQQEKDGSFTLLMVDEVFNQPSQKSLKEARGYVISEYQDFLEKEWHKELTAKYPVRINEKVLKSVYNRN